MPKFWKYLFFWPACLLYAQTTYYVSPSGSDSNTGLDTAHALATPSVALAKVTATSGGYTIYFRGGTYKYATQLKTPKAGVAGSPNRLFAYPGERPVFDFTGLKDRGIYISKDYWYLRGLEVCNAGSNGIIISSASGHNVVEGCAAHDNGLEGMKITGSTSSLAHDNLFLNCDSYRNYDDSTHGEDADGFAAKTGCGTGNIFKGCRSWNNSDDGWDFYSNSTGGLVIDSCWAFRNGVNLWSDASFAGDGDGFKLGGAGTTSQHVCVHCIAFDNTLSGFAQNYSKAGQTLINCTAFRNSSSHYNFALADAVSSGTLLKHYVMNCISYNGTNTFGTAIQSTSNSWQVTALTDADFVSLDTAGVTGPRNSDYSLPKLNFLHIAKTSALVNAGTVIALPCGGDSTIAVPYSGSSPDIGAYEADTASSATLIGKILNGDSRPTECKILPNYPNPFNPETTIKFQIAQKGMTTLKVYDAVGREVAVLIHEELPPGTYTETFDGSHLASGIYFSLLQTGAHRSVQKMMLLK
jgi:hypothetical protein